MVRLSTTECTYLPTYLGLGAGCRCVVCAVWSGVMVGSPKCAAGWWWVWSVVWCPVRVVGVGSMWAGWRWWLWLDCLVVAASVGGPDGGPRVCDRGWACMVVAAGRCVLASVAGCGTAWRVVCGN